MTELIPFQDAQGKAIYINPQDISYIKVVDESVIVGINGKDIELGDDLEFVRKALAGSFPELSGIGIK